MRVLHELLDDLAFDAPRRVDGDDEISDLVFVRVFERLDQRDVSVEIYAVRIVIVVEFLLGQPYGLRVDAEAFQELSVIVSCAVDRPETLRQRAAALLEQFEFGLHAL